MKRKTEHQLDGWPPVPTVTVFTDILSYLFGQAGAQPSQQVTTALFSLFSDAFA